MLTWRDVGRTFISHIKICYNISYGKDCDRYLYVRRIAKQGLYIRRQDGCLVCYGVGRCRKAVFIARPRRFGKSLAVSAYPSRPKSVPSLKSWWRRYESGGVGGFGWSLEWENGILSIALEREFVTRTTIKYLTVKKEKTKCVL